MPLSDLARALPGCLVVGLLPGLALLTVLVPRWPWWERVAAAPGMSAGLVGIVGLLDHDLHIGFTPAHVLPVLALPLVGAVLRRRRGSPAPRDRGELSGGDLWHPSRPAVAAVVGTALAVGLVSVGTVAWAFRDQPLPIETDAPVHAFVAEAIVRDHDVVPVMPSPVDGSAAVRPRTGFEATAAVASWIGGPSPTRTMLPLTLVAVLLLPLALAALAWATTGSASLATLATVFSLGFAMPRLPVTFGEFPLVVDSTLVVVLVLVTLRLVRGEDRWSHAGTLASLVAAVWVIHGLEAITAVVVGGPLVVGALLAGPRRPRLHAAAIALGAAGAGAALVTVLTRLPALPVAHQVAGAGPTRPQADFFLGIAGSPHDAVQAFHVFSSFDLATPVAVALYLVGIIAALLLRRRDRWAVVSSLLMLVCLVDVGYTVVFGRLWRAVFPWGEVDRLVSIQFFVAPIVIAVGALAAPQLLARLRGTMAAVPWSALLQRRAMAAACATAVLALAAVGTLQQARDYQDDIAAAAMVSASDVDALAQMSILLPPHTLVLTDGVDDAGQWIDALTPDLQFAPKDYVLAHVQQDGGGRPFLADSRTVALAHACDAPEQAAAALQGIGAVFVGSRVRPGSAHPWNATCIAQLPGVHEVLATGRSGTETVVFTVDGGAQPALTASSPPVSRR